MPVEPDRPELDAASGIGEYLGRQKDRRRAELWTYSKKFR